MKTVGDMRTGLSFILPLMGLTFFISLSLLSSDVKADVPTIESLGFSASLNQANIYWIIDMPGGGPVDVDCRINNDPAKSCQFSGNPGPNGCTVIGSDLYILTPSGVEPRTVANTIDCEACDSAVPADCDSKSETFYPLSFGVDAPPKIVAVVGEDYSIAITVNNSGTLADGYTISAVSSDPQTFSIKSGDLSTRSLDQGDYQRLYIDSVLISSAQSADVDISVTSNTSRDHVPAYGDITYHVIIPAYGSDKSLPDFGWLGILQIMLAAAVLVSFLF